MGRVKVKVDAAKFAIRFKDSFRLKKHSWSIVSDYCNLFKDVYRRKKGVSYVNCSDGAPVNLDLVVFAFGELGQPSYTNLIGKVQTYLLEEKSLHEVSQSIRGNLDWRIKRIPRRLIDDSDIDGDLGQLGGNTEIING